MGLAGEKGEKVSSLSEFTFVWLSVLHGLNHDSNSMNIHIVEIIIIFIIIINLKLNHKHWS